jgi:uncharacterized membrane protein
VYLMLATFATLIVLVQHISTMLQAPNIAAAAGAELLEVISGEITGEVSSGDGGTGGFDGKGGFQTRPDSHVIPDTLAEMAGYPVRARTTGYIQFIDPEILLTLARERDLVIRLLHKPGHYVASGAVVALVSPRRPGQRATRWADAPRVPDREWAHAHPGCRIRGQPAHRNGRKSHVSGDQ